jgi:hypothetical protein
MAGGHQVEKSRYALDMGSFQLPDKSRIIAVINGLLEGAPGTNLPTLSPVLRESKVKGRSFVHLPFRPDPATVTVDNVLDDGQTDAGAFILPAARD